MRAQPYSAKQEFDNLISSGRLAFERGDIKETIAVASTAVELSSLSADQAASLRCLLSEALAAAGKDLEAYQTIVRYESPSERADLSLSTLAQVELRLGHAYVKYGNTSEGIGFFKQSLSHAEHQADKRAIGEANFRLAWAHRLIGEAGLARQYIDQASDCFHQLSSQRLLFRAYHESGALELHRGNYAHALKELETAEKLSDPNADALLIGSVQTDIAMAYFCQGDFQSARVVYEKAVQHFRIAKHPRYLSRHTSNLGLVLMLCGDWKLARELMEESVDINSELGDPRLTAPAYDNLGKLAMLEGRFDQAKDYLHKADRMLVQAGDNWMRFEPLVNLARLYLSLGSIEQAKTFATEAFEIAEQLNHAEFLVRSLLLLAEIALTIEDQETCRRLMWEAEETLAQEPNLPLLASMRQVAGRLSAAQGKFEDARQLLSQSLSAFETMSDQYQIASSSLELGKTLAQVGLLNEAGLRIAEALETFGRLGAEPALSQAIEANALLQSNGPPRKRAVKHVQSSDGQNELQATGQYSLKRLIDASCTDTSCTEQFLLRELVAVSCDLTKAKEVILFRVGEEHDAAVSLCRGCSFEKASRLGPDIVRASQNRQWTTLGSGAYSFALTPRSRNKLLLYINTRRDSVSVDELRWLKLVAKLGEHELENLALRERFGRSETAKPPLMRCLESLPDLVVAGPVMRDILTRVRFVCDSDAPVLITGESGTGKELIAHAIHLESHRANHPFIPYNCTTIAREMVDSQLFGYKRGSFTGAVSDYPGIIRAAENGTIFLDEIGDLSLEVQPKLLRFLQDGEVFPLGEKRPVKTNVRVIASTNHNLEDDVRAGTFRKDLFYRLNFIRLHIPPLRTRRVEIEVLASHFFEYYKRKEDKRDIHLHKATIELLNMHGWPGNIRELRAEIERLVLYATQGEIIGPHKLSPDIYRLAQTDLSASAEDEQLSAGVRAMLNNGLTLDKAIEELERYMITEALERSGGNLTHAARRLKLTNKGLRDKLKRLGIRRS